MTFDLDFNPMIWQVNMYLISLNEVQNFSGSKVIAWIWTVLCNCVKLGLLSQVGKTCFVACAWWKSYEKLKYQSLGELFITFSKT